MFDDFFVKVSKTTGSKHFTNCDLCFKIVEKDKIKNHMQNAHETTANSFSCTLCESTFSELAACVQHNLNHKKQEMLIETQLSHKKGSHKATS